MVTLYASPYAFAAKGFYFKSAGITVTGITVTVTELEKAALKRQIILIPVTVIVTVI